MKTTTIIIIVSILTIGGVILTLYLTGVFDSRSEVKGIKNPNPGETFIKRENFTISNTDWIDSIRNSNVDDKHKEILITSLKKIYTDQCIDLDKLCRDQTSQIECDKSEAEVQKCRNYETQVYCILASKMMDDNPEAIEYTIIAFKLFELSLELNLDDIGITMVCKNSDGSISDICNNDTFKSINFDSDPNNVYDTGGLLNQGVNNVSNFKEFMKAVFDHHNIESLSDNRVGILENCENTGHVV